MKIQKAHQYMQKRWKEIISPSIFEARCLGLEQAVVAVEGYNIAVMARYTTLSVAVESDC